MATNEAFMMEEDWEVLNDQGDAAQDQPQPIPALSSPPKITYADVVKGVVPSVSIPIPASTSIDRKNHTSTFMFSSSSPGYSSEFTTLLLQNTKIAMPFLLSESEQKLEQALERDEDDDNETRHKSNTAPVKSVKTKLRKGWQKIDLDDES